MDKRYGGSKVGIGRIQMLNFIIRCIYGMSAADAKRIFAGGEPPKGKCKTVVLSGDRMCVLP